MQVQFFSQKLTDTKPVKDNTGKVVGEKVRRSFRVTECNIFLSQKEEPDSSAKVTQFNKDKDWRVVGQIEAFKEALSKLDIDKDVKIKLWNQVMVRSQGMRRFFGIDQGVRST